MWQVRACSVPLRRLNRLGVIVADRETRSMKRNDPAPLGDWMAQPAKSEVQGRDHAESPSTGDALDRGSRRRVEYGWRSGSAARPGFPDCPGDGEWCRRRAHAGGRAVPPGSRCAGRPVANGRADPGRRDNRLPQTREQRSARGALRPAGRWFWTLDALLSAIRWEGGCDVSGGSGRGGNPLGHRNDLCCSRTGAGLDPGSTARGWHH